MFISNKFPEKIFGRNRLTGNFQGLIVGPDRFQIFPQIPEAKCESVSVVFLMTDSAKMWLMQRCIRLSYRKNQIENRGGTRVKEIQ